MHTRTHSHTHTYAHEQTHTHAHTRTQTHAQAHARERARASKFLFSLTHGSRLIYAQLWYFVFKTQLNDATWRNLFQLERGRAGQRRARERERERERLDRV